MGLVSFQLLVLLSTAICRFKPLKPKASGTFTLSIQQVGVKRMQHFSGTEIVFLTNLVVWFSLKKYRRIQK